MKSLCELKFSDLQNTADEYWGLEDTGKTGRRAAYTVRTGYRMFSAFGHFDDSSFPVIPRLESYFGASSVSCKGTKIAMECEWQNLEVEKIEKLFALSFLGKGKGYIGLTWVLRHNGGILVSSGLSLENQCATRTAKFADSPWKMVAIERASRRKKTAWLPK